MKYKSTMAGTLLIKTIELLRNDERTSNDLHIKTGLPYYWLKALRDDPVYDPSVNRIEYLYTFLNKKPLLKQSVFCLKNGEIVKYKHMMAGTLLIETLEMLRNDKKPTVELYLETGIPFYWLKSLRSKKSIPNPSVNKVEYLYNHLSKNPLFEQVETPEN